MKLVINLSLFQMKAKNVDASKSMIESSNCITWNQYELIIWLCPNSNQ